MKHLFLLPILMMLAGCDGVGLNDRQRDEVGDVAGDVAYDIVTEHERIKKLESRIEELESQIDELESRFNY